jgi:hypothetical protein
MVTIVVENAVDERRHVVRRVSSFGVCHKYTAVNRLGNNHPCTYGSNGRNVKILQQMDGAVADLAGA